MLMFIFSDDMYHSSNKILMPEIFENPLSKVRMVRSYCNPVAAIIASGSVIFFFCFNCIAISLISSLYGISIVSWRSALQIFICPEVMPGLPNNSTSVIKETANNFSVYGISLLSPSRRLIRILVSAKKSIFTPHFFLIGQSVQPTFQSAKMLFERGSLFTLLKFS